MAVQQYDGTPNIGQNILLAAIIIVLIYIVLDIFGFIPSVKKNGNRRRKRGGFCPTGWSCDKWVLPVMLIAAAVAGSMAMNSMG